MARWIIPPLVALGIIAAALVIPGPARLAGNSAYTAPQIARIQAELPASLLTPQMHVLCLVRAEPGGAAAEHWLTWLCYSSIKPDAAPTPPPPPYQAIPPVDPGPAQHITSATFDSGTGRLAGAFFDCLPVIQGIAYIYADYEIDMNKALANGAGTFHLLLDIEPSFDCAAGAEADGTATLTGLDLDHDEDGDGCPDYDEPSDDEGPGGLRDPFNHWDYFNPTHDGLNRVDDILRVVDQHFLDKGNPAYTKETDRTAIIGGNPWNFGPPNGPQRVDGILAAVRPCYHRCSAE